jgi:predicted aspartyl protease
MARADRVAFLPGGRLVTVLATLNVLLDVNIIADTGAQRTMISRKVAQRLGLHQPLRMEALVGVGQSPPVPVVRLDRLRVGASTMVGLEVSVYDLPPLISSDGLLGLDFLRRFRVTFDFVSGVLILREPSKRGIN